MKKCEFHAWQRSKRQKLYFRCRHPDCVAKKHRKDLVGKRALCWFCRTPFILTQEMLRRATPHCGCGGKGEEADLIPSVLKETPRSEALNTSSQVQPITIDEDQKFDPITTALKASGFPIELIAFRENDEREWDVREIVQRLACFLKDRWKDTPPTIMYKSKKKALDLYTTESTRPEFLRLSDVMADLVRLPEFIESGLSSVLAVKLRSKYRLGWVKKLLKPSARPGTNYQREYQMDPAASLPLAAAFREILELRDDRYYWTVDPKFVFDRCAEDLYKLLVNKCKPLKAARDLGSDTEYWTKASLIVLRAKTEILQERGQAYSPKVKPIDYVGAENSPEIVQVSIGDQSAVGTYDAQIKSIAPNQSGVPIKILKNKAKSAEDKRKDKLMQQFIKDGVNYENAERLCNIQSDLLKKCRMPD